MKIHTNFCVSRPCEHKTHIHKISKPFPCLHRSRYISTVICDFYVPGKFPNFKAYVTSNGSIAGDELEIL